MKARVGRGRTFYLVHQLRNSVSLNFILEPPTDLDGSAAVSRADELLNGEMFYTLLEARVLIERWRQHYNRFRSHSALGYWPPAPVVIQPRLGEAIGLT